MEPMSLAGPPGVIGVQNTYNAPPLAWRAGALHKGLPMRGHRGIPLPDLPYRTFTARLIPVSPDTNLQYLQTFCKHCRSSIQPDKLIS